MAERKARQMTFRGLQRRIDRDERRQLRRSQGQWFGLASRTTINLSGSTHGAEIFFPVPGANAVAASRADSKVEIYGLDVLLSVQAIQASGASGPTTGAIVVCHYRAGQSGSNYVPSNGAFPVGVQPQGLARPKKVVPFTIFPPISSSGGNSNANVVMPIAALVGKAFTLVEDEAMAFNFALDSTQSPHPDFQVALLGRYRYIKPNAK